MLKQYIKQAWRVLKENPVLSTITILGTALSIAMIMTLVMADRIRHGNFAPENTRNRTLYVRNIKVIDKSKGLTSNGRLGLKVIKQVFEPMTTPEALYFMLNTAFPVRVPGTDNNADPEINLDNGSAWLFFNYDFIAGSPYTDADVKAAAKKAVITDELAVQLFGITDVVGRTILLPSEEEYIISGVVREPSSLATYANSGMWIPYTSTKMMLDDDTNSTGGFELIMLAKDRKDFAKIKEEMAERVAYFNSNDSLEEIDFRMQPDTHRKARFTPIGDGESKYASYIRTQVLLILLFLLVPAINLSLITTSRMKKRAAEIGIRRAYGASTQNIVSQVVWESLVFTVIGSVVGFLLSMVGFFMNRKILFKGFAVADLRLELWDILRPEVFILTILFCLLLNLISSIVPAIRSSKSNVINNLYEV